jgi:hypothetical protein
VKRWSQTSAKFNRTKKRVTVHNSDATHARLVQLGITSMAVTRLLNDPVQAQLRGILTVSSHLKAGSLSRTPRASQLYSQSRHARCPDTRCQIHPRRSGASLCKSSCNQRTLILLKEITPHLITIPVSLGCSILVEGKIQPWESLHGVPMFQYCWSATTADDRNVKSRRDVNGWTYNQ